ncbi:MAG: hypothetical protein QM499_01005 [Flavobacteriaceae bacterium]
MKKGTSFLSREIKLPNWLLGVVVILIIVLIATGSTYTYSEFKSLKSSYSDSLKVRDKRVELLELTIENANNFEDTETVKTKTYWKEYLRERKLRKDAENNLFIYRNYTRKYIDSFLSNYKFRRTQ